MRLVLQIFSSPTKLLKLVALVILSALTETMLIFSLSKFEASSADLNHDALVLIILTTLSLMLRLASLWVVNKECLSAVSLLNIELLDIVHKKSLNNRLQSFNFSSQAEKIQIVGTSVLVPVVNGIASLFVGMFIFAALVSLYGLSVLWIAIFIVFFYVIAVLSVKGKLRLGSKILANYQSQRALLINETADGANELEFSSTFCKQKRRYIKNEASFVGSASGVLFLGGMPRFILETLLIIAMIFMVLFGQTNELSAADIVTFAFACLRLVPLAQQTYNGWARYRGNQTAIQEILEASTNFKHTKVFKSPKNHTIIENGQRFSMIWHEKVKHVKMPPNLKIDFELRKFTVLSGRSGIGKSTLIHNLIRNLKDPCISVGLVAPYNARFSCTVGEYFEFFDVVNQKKIKQLAKVFNFQKDLGQNFLTTNIIKLSTGEFQRIQLIREIIRAPRLLILDEAFSNLDKRTTKAALSKLKLMRNTAFLLVSHSTILDVPKLMELNLNN